MIQSMTAFVTKSLQQDNLLISCDIRSLNSKNLDLNLRVENQYRALEKSLYAKIKDKITRGRIDLHVQISFGLNKNMLQPNIDLALIENFALQLSSVQKLIGEKILVNWTDILNIATKEHGIIDNLSYYVELCVDAALNELMAEKEREGSQIIKILQNKTKVFETILNNIIQNIDEHRNVLHNKFINKLAKLDLTTIEPSRLEQEVFFYMQKSDVTEEIDRINIHLLDFSNTLVSCEKHIGRKLDFILQELMREANTLVAKMHSLATDVIELKLIIEQLREQVQNLE